MEGGGKRDELVVIDHQHVGGGGPGGGSMKAVVEKGEEKKREEGRARGMKRSDVRCEKGIVSNLVSRETNIASCSERNRSVAGVQVATVGGYSKWLQED